MILLYILIATFLISAISFVGALTFFLKEKFLNKTILILVAFSAGALIGGAFLHLLPEAIMEVGLEEYQLIKIFLYLLSGFCFFFVLEQFISWHHHHAIQHPEINPVRDSEDNEEPKVQRISNGVNPFSYLILISDGIHNFIDGLIIAASFVVALSLGLATTLVVALHEIPQEIGDFGVLIYGGFNKTKALFLNFLSAILAIFGGLVGFLLSEKIGDSIVFLLPFAAGNFIYIAASDLIPEIKQKEVSKKSLIYFSVFLLGIILMLIMKLLFEE